MSSSRCPFMILLMCCVHYIMTYHLAWGTTAHRQKRFTKADICRETFDTLAFVALCPDTESIKLEQSKKKQCETYPTCNGEPLVYHCVRFKDRLAEVCAPRHIITGKCCALYDEGLGRVVEDYSKPCSDCSYRYQSDDVVKYSKCIETNLTRKACSKEGGRSKRGAECDKSEEKSSGNMDKDGSSTSTNIVVTAVVSIICLIVAIGGISYCIGRHLKITSSTIRNLWDVSNQKGNNDEERCNMVIW